MTCDQFKLLYAKATTGEGTLLDLTIAERTASCIHYNKCESCRIFVNNGALEELEKDPPTEKQQEAIDKAVHILIAKDRLDPESRVQKELESN